MTTAGAGDGVGTGTGCTTVSFSVFWHAPSPSVAATVATANIEYFIRGPSRFGWQKAQSRIRTQTTRFGLAAQVERLQSKAEPIEAHALLTGVGVQEMAYEHDVRFEALHLEIRDAVRALKAATTARHEIVSLEVRRWSGRAH